MYQHERPTESLCFALSKETLARRRGTLRDGWRVPVSVVGSLLLKAANLPRARWQLARAKGEDLCHRSWPVQQVILFFALEHTSTERTSTENFLFSSFRQASVRWAPNHPWRPPRSRSSSPVVTAVTGRKYLLAPRDLLTIPKLNDVAVGDVIELDNVHELGSRESTLQGAPHLSSNVAKTTATVVEHTKGQMECTVKKKRRKGYEKTIQYKHNLYPACGSAHSSSHNTRDHSRWFRLPVSHRTPANSISYFFPPGVSPLSGPSQCHFHAPLSANCELPGGSLENKQVIQQSTHLVPRFHLPLPQCHFHSPLSADREPPEGNLDEEPLRDN